MESSHFHGVWAGHGTELLRVLLIAGVGALGCGAKANTPADAPARGPDVIIPRVTEEQSKAAAKEASAPVGERDPLSAVLGDSPEVGGTDDPWASGGSSLGPRGGVDCDRAADCCMKFYQRTAADPSVLKVCNSFRIAPATVCATVLSSYQQVAQQSGIQCN
jgi:hypothetical protein